MKRKVFLLLPLILGLNLVSCANKSTSMISSDPEIVEPGVPSEPGEPSEPEKANLLGIAISGEFKENYEIDEEFDPTGIVVTASYDDETSKDVTAETVFSGFDSSEAGKCHVTATYEDKTAEIILTIWEHSYTVEEVASDIGDLLGITLSDKGTYYGVSLNFSEDGVDYSDTQAAEDVLSPVVNTLYYYYMPEYLELVGAAYFAPEDDFWGDESGDTAYYAYLEVDEVGVDLISYCYNGYLIGQIAVYSIAE